MKGIVANDPAGLGNTANGIRLGRDLGAVYGGSNAREAFCLKYKVKTKLIVKAHACTYPCVTAYRLVGIGCINRNGAGGKCLLLGGEILVCKVLGVVLNVALRCCAVVEHINCQLTHSGILQLRAAAAALVLQRENCLKIRFYAYRFYLAQLCGAVGGIHGSGHLIVEVLRRNTRKGKHALKVFGDLGRFIIKGNGQLRAITRGCACVEFYNNVLTQRNAHVGNAFCFGRGKARYGKDNG